ncbi:tropomyosin-1-like [Gossypium hirsutum]|uniref:Tropomyosin-1-like n=1 Tax=Gossypium hirsutum TaxID=3635 RepID=A0ABM2ZNL7_GOSHI|nr:tropomyosin-1-like [Gossypium hirsutum]
MKIAGLGKNSEQWRAKIRKEKEKVDRWERKFQETQIRNEDLEKSLSDSQREKGELSDRVTQLERSLRQYQNRNSAIELRASLGKIEEMKKRIEELETTLQNCEIRIECLEAIESHNKEQLHYFQNHVRSRDHIMEEAVVQIREVVDHIQTLAVQADMLSVKYELESDQGQELAVLLRKIRMLSNRAKLCK